MRPYGRHDPGAIHAGHEHPARERRVVGKEARDLRHDPAREAEGAHVRPVARPGPGDDLGHAIAPQIRGRYVDATLETRVVGEEAVAPQLGEPAIEEVEDTHVWTAAGTGARHDVGDAITVDIADGHVHATRERRVVSEEAVVEDLDELTIDVAPEPDVRPAARTGAGNDFRDAIAGHVAARDGHTTRKRRIVGEEARKLRHDAARDPVDAHVRPAAWTGPGDQLVDAIAVDIALRRVPHTRTGRCAV